MYNNGSWNILAIEKKRIRKKFPCIKFIFFLFFISFILADTIRNNIVFYRGIKID